MVNRKYVLTAEQEIDNSEEEEEHKSPCSISDMIL